jgi:hypothetical protein
MMAARNPSARSGRRRTRVLAVTVAYASNETQDQRLRKLSEFAASLG